MLIYNTVTGQVVDRVPIKNLQTGNPDYDLIAQMIYNQQYKTYSNEVITFNLSNTNSSASSNMSNYLTVDLINNTIYLQDKNWQILNSKQFNSQQDLLTYLDKTYRISPYSVIEAANPPLVTNTSNQTIFNPTAIKNITTGDNNISSTQYIIPGTTMTTANYTPSINIKAIKKD